MASDAETIKPCGLEENLEGTVRCMVCDFRFGAEHIDVIGEGYSCPVCEETRLTAEVKQLRTWLDEEKEFHRTAYVAGYRMGQLDNSPPPLGPNPGKPETVG